MNPSSAFDFESPGCFATGVSSPVWHFSSMHTGKICILTVPVVFPVR